MTISLEQLFGLRKSEAEVAAERLLTDYGAPGFVQRLTPVTTTEGTLEPSEIESQDERVEVTLDEALLSSALIQHSDIGEEGSRRYALLLDLDIPVHVRTSSSGNTHLYADVSMTKDQHDLVLAALAVAGVIEPGYGKSGRRSIYGSTLRLPWVKKGEDLPLAGQSPA